MSRPRVLVIEDDAATADMILLWLELEKFDTHIIRNGTDAISGIQSYRPDLVLLDLALPGPDGWQILAEIRRSATTADLPVIIVTAHGESGRIRAGQAGADGFLAKPFEPRKLMELVRMHLPPASEAA